MKTASDKDKDPLTTEESRYLKKLKKLFSHEDTTEMGLNTLQALHSPVLTRRLVRDFNRKDFLYQKSVRFTDKNVHLYHILNLYPELFPQFKPEELVLENFPLEKLPRLPERLKKFTLKFIELKTDISDFFIQCSRLEELTLYALPVNRLPQLPSTIRKLTLEHLDKCTDLSQLCSLPDLRELALFNLPVEVFPEVPRTLEKLSIGNIICRDYQSLFRIDHLEVTGKNRYNYLFKKAEWLSDENRPEESMRIYRILLDEYPDNYAAWNNIGNELYDLARYGEALEAYQKALKYLPYPKDKEEEDYQRISRFHSNIGKVYYKTGDLDKTLFHWKKSRVFDPSFIGAAANLAEVYIALRKPEKSLEVLEEFLKNTDNPVFIGICLFLKSIALFQTSGSDEERLETEIAFRENSRLYKGHYRFTAKNIYRYFENEPGITRYIRNLAEGL